MERDDTWNNKALRGFERKHEAQNVYGEPGVPYSATKIWRPNESVFDLRTRAFG
jgi:hypothetical protein